MGLFSLFNKNKQDRAADDSGRFYSKDDDAALGERARAKRPGNAGGGATRRPGNDPLLPEKKRARRRLVGAIALALAAAVGLPMLLDSGPKPLAGDIAIQIPSKDKAAPLPAPGEPEAQSEASQGAGDKAVAARDSVDQDEEIIEAPGAAIPAATAPAPKAPAVAAAPKPPEPKAAPARSEPQDGRADTRGDTRADNRLAEQRAERAERERAEKAEKAEREHAYRLERERAERAERERIARAERAEKLRAEEKARARAEEKPVKPAPPQDSARALAILEGKPAEKAKPVDAAGQKFVLQVAAMSSQEKAAEVQARLREAGISSYTLKAGDLIKVRVGPLNKDDAERMRARLGKLGLSGFMTPA